MCAAQRLLENNVAEILQHEACCRLESYALGDQAIGIWTLLYKAADNLDGKLHPSDSPLKALRLFLEETLRAYQSMTGEPWEPRERPAPAELKLVTMPEPEPAA
jgi:hypothetical protein